MPLWGGAQLAVDTTVASALTASGAPCRHAGTCVGVALRVARQAKKRTCPELRQSRRCRLVVLGIECAGRWSAEAASFIRLLARCKARAAPHSSRTACTSSYVLVLRWSGLLACAAARAFLSSLLGLPLSATANVDGDSPLISDLLSDSAEAPPLASRLA